MNILRIIVDVLFFVALFFMPWWSLYIVVPLLVFYFSSYYEIFLYAVLFDGLYAVSDHVWGMPFTLYTAGVFLVSLYLKKRLTFYS